MSDNKSKDSTSPIMHEAKISRYKVPKRLNFATPTAFLLILTIGFIGFYAFPDNLALLTRIISIALLVLSLDLITGYCGIATLGQAALFGTGAYAAGISSAHFGIHDPILMTLIGLIAGACAGLISGAIILRAHGLAQLVLSIAVVQLFHEIANKASQWTGGSDGLGGISVDPLLGIFEFDLWGQTAYLYGLFLLVLVVFILIFIVRSPFGLLCQAIKQDPVRVEAMGASIRSNQLRMYIIAGSVAGIGGALNAISTQVVGLDSLSFTLSAESLVMLVVGGTGSLYGALIGAVTFLWFEHIVSAANPFYWLTIIGAVLIAVVLFAPQGLYGSLQQLLKLVGVKKS